MRILFVSDTYYPHLNGVYYFVCRLGPLLQQNGHEVIVIAPSETAGSTKKKIDGIDVYGMPSLPLLYYPRLRFPVSFGLKSKIRQLVNEFRPDVIHIQDHFVLSKAMVAVNKKLNIPLVATNHFMPENLTALFKNKTLKKLIEQSMWSRFTCVFNQATVVTTPTETGACLIRPKLQREVKAISSGIDLEEFNPLGQNERIKQKYGLPDKPILLFVGRLDPEKHVDEILRAAAIALKKIDFCFVVVGKGVQKKMWENLAEELAITADVKFTGFVPDKDLPHFYKLSHCFIIASTAELLSLAVLQAMASGLPVVAVKAGALVELVEDGVNGFLYETGAINSIVRHLVTIFTQHKLHRSMAERSLEISQQHDIRQTVVSFERLYDSCIRKEHKLVNPKITPEKATISIQK